MYSFLPSTAHYKFGVSQIPFLFSYARTQISCIIEKSWDQREQLDHARSQLDFLELGKTYLKFPFFLSPTHE